MNLGFQMAHFTDSPLEAVKVCKGGNGCWKVVPLNDCKGIERVHVLVVISLGIYLSVSQWVSSAGSTSKWDDICRERYMLHNHKYSYKKGPDVNQHAAAPGLPIMSEMLE